MWVERVDKNNEMTKLNENSSFNMHDVYHYSLYSYVLAKSNFCLSFLSVLMNTVSCLLESILVIELSIELVIRDVSLADDGLLGVFGDELK